MRYRLSEFWKQQAKFKEFVVAEGLDKVLRAMLPLNPPAVCFAFPLRLTPGYPQRNKTHCRFFLLISPDRRVWLPLPTAIHLVGEGTHRRGLQPDPNWRTGTRLGWGLCLREDPTLLMCHWTAGCKAARGTNVRAHTHTPPPPPPLSPPPGEAQPQQPQGGQLEQEGVTIGR